jgi:hypothetical protein
VQGREIAEGGRRLAFWSEVLHLEASEQLRHVSSGKDEELRTIEDTNLANVTVDEPRRSTRRKRPSTRLSSRLN